MSDDFNDIFNYDADFEPDDPIDSDEFAADRQSMKGSEEELALAILDELGIESMDSIVVNVGAIKNPGEIRAYRFSTIFEVIIFLHSIGILTFSYITENDDGTFGAATGRSSDNLPDLL